MLRVLPLILLTAGPLLAQTTATAPTSTTSTTAPATRSTVTIAPAAVINATPKLIILRFAQLDDRAGTAWIGRAVQQSLLAEASRLPAIAPAAPGDTSKPAVSMTDPEQAVAYAKAAGARFIIIGGYQSADAELRLTGQVIDADSNQVLGGLKATGTPRDLFGMEDTLASQMRRILAAKISPATQPSSKADWWETSPVAAAPPRLPRGWAGSDIQRAVARESSPLLREEYDRFRFAEPTYFDGGYGYGVSTRFGSFGGMGGYGWRTGAAIRANYSTDAHGGY